MEKKILVEFRGKCVRLGLRPDGFVLTGTIEEIYDESFKFKTRQKTSFLDFSQVLSISLATDEEKAMFYYSKMGRE